jgi:hypothetical protein
VRIQVSAGKNAGEANEFTEAIGKIEEGLGEEEKQEQE